MGAAAHAGVPRLPEHPRAAARASPTRRCRSCWNGASGAPLAEPERGVLPPAARALREPASARSPTRACSTSAAAGAGSRASSPATSPPGRLLRLRPGRVDPRRLPPEPRAGDARAERVPPRAAAVRRAVRPRVRVLRLHAPLGAGARALPGGPARRAARPAAILVVTIRPPGYLRSASCCTRCCDGWAADRAAGRAALPVRRRTRPTPTHPQYAGGEMTYGETVITLPYVRERWSRWFELLHVDLLLGDLHQVVLTLRRRGRAPPVPAETEAFWRALRARHPSAARGAGRRRARHRAATAASATSSARALDAARADASRLALGQRRVPRRRRSTALKARLQARGVPVLPRLAHRLAMALAQVSIGDPVVVAPRRLPAPRPGRDRRARRDPRRRRRSRRS